MSSLQLYPEVIDGSTLGARPTSAVFFPIGIEGAMDADGTAAEKELHLISRPSEAQGFFGVASSLTKLITYVLDRGAGPVWAIASKKTTAPILTDRQAAWQTLENRREIRIRLTDSTTNADHVALATSCDNANLLNNKQFAIVGMTTGTTKATLLTSATALNHRRIILVAPGIYDDTGVFRSGAYGAASLAAMRAINGDISDDMDTATVPKLSGLEKDSLGNNVFRQLVVGGIVVNDFEDLLQGGVSPFMTGLDGGVAISHVRMAYKTDTTFDSWTTRLAMDQLFILIRDYAVRFNSLRKGNTPNTRNQLKSGIDALIRAQGDIVQPDTLGDGSEGYGVEVIASPDQRQQIISYTGEIVRGTQTILVQGNLTIAV